MGKKQQRGGGGGRGQWLTAKRKQQKKPSLAVTAMDRPKPNQIVQRTHMQGARGGLGGGGGGGGGRVRGTGGVGWG